MMIKPLEIINNDELYILLTNCNENIGNKTFFYHQSGKKLYVIAVKAFDPFMDRKTGAAERNLIALKQWNDFLFDEFHVSRV